MDNKTINFYDDANGDSANLLYAIFTFAVIVSAVIFGMIG